MVARNCTSDQLAKGFLILTAVVHPLVHVYELYAPFLSLGFPATKHKELSMLCKQCLGLLYSKRTVTLHAKYLGTAHSMKTLGTPPCIRTESPRCTPGTFQGTIRGASHHHGKGRMRHTCSLQTNSGSRATYALCSRCLPCIHGPPSLQRDFCLCFGAITTLWARRAGCGRE